MRARKFLLPIVAFLLLLEVATPVAAAPLGQSKGPNIEVFNFNPSGGQVSGQDVIIHIRTEQVPGAVTVDVSCGGVSKAETSEMEFDSTWRDTASCSGSETATVCARANDDPNWANATCASKGYSFSQPANPLAIPEIDFWADSTSIAAGKCTTLYWQTEGADWVELDANRVANDGSQNVCPAITKKYNLTAGNVSGNAYANVKVQVSTGDPAPSLSDPSKYFYEGDVIEIDGRIYVIVVSGGTRYRRWVPNPDSLDALGITRSMIDNKGFSDAELRLIQEGSDIPDVNRNYSGFQDFKEEYFPNLAPIVPAPSDQGEEPSLPTSGICSGQTTRMSLNSKGVITEDGVDLRLRRDHSLSAGIIRELPTGYRFTIINGPVCQDGFTWWQISGDYGTGWSAEAGVDDGRWQWWMAPRTETQVSVPTPAPTPVQNEFQTTGENPLTESSCEQLGGGQWWNPFNPPEVGAAQQCTAYVAGLTEEVGQCWGKGVWPNGGLWDDWARDPARSGSCGWTVYPSNPNGTADFSKATPGDLVVWDPASQNGGSSCLGANSQAGHVAVFLGRNGDGTISVSEDNWARDHSTVPVDPSCMSVIHIPTVSSSVGTPTPQVDKCSQYTWFRWLWCKITGR